MPDQRQPLAPETGRPGPRWAGRGRLLVAGVAAILLLTGALNLRVAFGSDPIWQSDPAAPSPVDRLIGAPPRPPSRLDGQIADLQATLRADAANGQAATLLGQAYLQKARETGDPTYYPKAEALFRQALAAGAEPVEAQVGLGTLALARHRFAEALEWGEQARAANRYHAPAYAVVGDAQIELGRYDDALVTVQAMVDLRPDLASYARVSYLRELLGDRPGALAAMEQAATAGATYAENVAWVQSHLGTLLFDGGDLAGAERAYAEAVAVLPGYPPALAGQARLAAAGGDLDRAAARSAEAVAASPLPEFVVLHRDILAAAGRPAEAAAQDALLDAIALLQRENGVEIDLELALYAADRGLPAEMPTAVARAQAQAAKRPSVVADDVLAWTLYRAGDFPAARAASQRALRLGSANAGFFFHAGMIEAALGDRPAAITHLQAALDLNPHFSVRDAPVARATLNRLLAAEGSR